MGLGPPVRSRLRLLYVGDAELARQCLGRPGGSIEVFEAIPTSAGVIPSADAGGLPFDILLIEHGHAGADALAILKDLGTRAVAAPVVVVAEWDEELAVRALQLGASDYVTKSRASFRAIYFRLHRLRAHAALLAGQTRESSGNSHNQLTTAQLEAHREARADAERRLSEAIAAIRQAREGRFADAVVAAKELAQRESIFGTKLQAAEATIRSLEQSLAERNAALRDIEAREAAELVSSERVVVRHHELETQLAKELESRRTLEARLERAIEALRAAEQQRLTEAAASADRIALHESDAAAIAERMSREHHALDERLDAAIGALEQARTDRAADVEAAARHLAEREETLVAQIREASGRADHLGRRLTNAEAALRCADQRVTAERLAGQQRTAEQHAEFEAELSRQLAIRETLRQQIGDARNRLEQAEARRVADEHHATTRLTEQQAEHAAQLTEAGLARERLESRLASLESALHEATERHASAMREAAALSAEHHADYSAQLAEGAQVRAGLENRLASLESALNEASEQHAGEMEAAASRSAEQRAEFTARLSEVDQERDALRKQLESAVAALREAEERHSSETSDAAAHFAEQHAQLTARLAEADESQHALRTQLATSEAALQDATQRHAADMSETAARFAESREEAGVRLAQAGAAILMLENELAESEDARQRGEEAHASAMADAAERLADHQQETATWLAEAAVFANTLEAELADGIDAFHRLEQQAATDREAAIEASRKQQAAFDSRLAEADARRQAVSVQLQATEIAFQDAGHRHSRETREAAARLTDVQEKYEARLTQADTAIKVAESKRAEAIASLDRVVRQATAERQAASEESRQRQARFDGSLREEAERRQQVEKDLYHTRMAFEEARLQFVNDLAVATERGIESEARLEAQAAEERAAWDRVRSTAEAEIQHLQKESERLHQSLVAAVREIRRLETAQHREREESERTRTEIDAELARQREGAAALQRVLEKTRTAARETLEEAVKDATKEHSRLAALIADRETELHDQVSRAQASDAAAAAALADVEQRLNLSLAARDRDRDAMARLQSKLDATNQELESTSQQREALRVTAGQIPALQEQIDVIQATNRRGFEDTLVSRFRSSRTGAITEVNIALARMLGYDSVSQLQAIDFRQAVFESADELQWLADRCVASRTGESIDTTWKRTDGTRIIVRVMAVATSGDSIDLVAEDMTPLRVVEEKLRHARRLEAVARYGSEVAVTCHSLLTHVKQEGQLWLDRMESDVARYQGQSLFDDVAKAAGFLGQLVTYGEEQRSAPEVVEMNTVLRDLAPVLKRVAGDDIDIVLPEMTTPLPLDVDSRPVERMLVNVAAYGRERMPRGGRLVIDVDSVVVGREFVEKHPNVRPGAHVVLTVNEVRRPDAPGLVEAVLIDSGKTGRIGSSAGLELGTLQALVSDCGGHLWMKAEPPGNMVLKIHLPRRILDRSDSPGPAMARVRSGWLQRAFGSRH